MTVHLVLMFVKILSASDDYKNAVIFPFYKQKDNESKLISIKGIGLLSLPGNDGQNCSGKHMRSNYE